MSKSIPPAADQAEAAARAPSSTSTIPSSTLTSPHTTEYYGTPVWMHAACLGVTVLGPIGLALPPRRMSMRNLMLVAGTFLGTSQLAYDYTGESIYQRFRSRTTQALDEQQQDLPASALQRQAAMRAERERRMRAAAVAAGQIPKAAAEPADLAAAERSRLQKLWMGNEKDGWVEERAKRERETLESGGSYWDLIMNQIGEVVEDLSPKTGVDKAREERCDEDSKVAKGGDSEEIKARQKGEGK